ALRSQFFETVARFRPDVVSILLGLEEAQQSSEAGEDFKASLSALILDVLDINALPILQTPHWIDVARLTGLGDLRRYVRAIRETAQELDVLLVDHWSYWKRAQFAVPDPEAWLMSDRIEPNVYGQRVMAGLLLKTLGLHGQAGHIEAPSPDSSAAM